MVTFVHQMRNLISRWIWRQRFNLKRVLIVGLSQTAMKLKDTLSNSPDLGYDLVGLISLEKNSNNSLVDQTTGNVDELIEICHRERVQEVIFVSIENNYEKIIRSLIKCRKMLIDIRIISDDFESQAINPRIKDFAGFSSIDHECQPLYYIGLGIKRLADIIIASVGLVILSPFILLIALLLKFDGNSAFYNQIRIGKDGKKFLMYKFRTMVPGAESQKADLENIAANGPFFKVRDDPRVTRFGKLLRKYNLDEIPQLLNVLRGELSFIGPRPPLPEEVSEYEDWHLSRLEIKPGITGLWQVDKKRKWKFDEMIKLDIYYILNWSILLDLKILLRTPGAILKGSGL
jgi:exopolysaccharide biosynthesis polyprenyl glycosylphosphotransferase